MFSRPPFLACPVICIYLSLPTDGLYLSSSFLALYLIDGCSAFLLVPDMALDLLLATMGLGSIHVSLMSRCYCASYDFSSCHSWTPWPALVASPGRCILPPAWR